MKNNIFIRIFLILIIVGIIAFSGFWIVRKLSPSQPGNDYVTDTSPTPTEPPESVASGTSAVESEIITTPSLSPLEKELEMYVLKKVDSNLYKYEDMLFKTDNDGTLYIGNKDGKYDVFCKAESTDPHSATEAVPEDIHSKYKDAMNEYGEKNQIRFTGLNDYYYVCSYEDYDYFELILMNGAGSGEYWGGKNSGIYLGIHQSTGEIKEFDDIRAGYCKEKDNWVYYLDLINYDQERAKDFPVSGGEIVGIGRICRMRPDTGENQVLSEDVAVNGFQFHDDKIYYVSFEDNKVKVISMDGEETYYADRNFVFDESFFKCPYTMRIFGNFLLFEEYGYNYEYSYIIIPDDLSAFRKIQEPEDAHHLGVLCTDEHSILISFYSDIEESGDNALYLVSDLGLAQ